MKLSSYKVTLDSISLASSTIVTNLRVILDQNLFFDSRSAFIVELGTSCLKAMRNNCSMHLLFDWTAVILYYWAVQKKSLKSLQMIQNAATRVLMRTNRRDHVSPGLASLHWLDPVRFRIELKILLLT